MTVEVRGGPFDPWTEIRVYQEGHPQLRAAAGATAVFVGTMRDFSDSLPHVESMTLEHYAGMTERCLEEIRVVVCRRWDILDTLVLHRVGELRPGEPIVLVAVWSAHRAAAFDACRAIMEALKSRAPFWKKESSAEGERWVTDNTPGTSVT